MDRRNENLLFVLLALMVAMCMVFVLLARQFPEESVPGMDGWVAYSKCAIPEDIPVVGCWGFAADEFAAVVRIGDNFYGYEADPAKPVVLLYEEPPHWWILMPGVAR